MESARGHSNLLHVVANGLLFNISWLVIVSTHSSMLAPLVAAVHLSIHFKYFSRCRTEWRLITMVTLMGLLLDQALFLAGVFNLSGTPSLAPLWLSCLWPVLATTLMHAFSSLQQRQVAASLLGGLGGALSYVAGTRLSDVEFASALWGPVLMGGVWAMLFPALLLGARLAAENDRQHGAL